MAQLPIFGNTGGINLNGHIYSFWNTGDSVMRFFPTFIRDDKPMFMPTYTYAGRPSASLYGGCWVYTSDSLKMYYSNGSSWVDPLAGSGGGGGVSLPFADNTAFLKNSADATKQFIISLSGLTTGTTRTWTLPDVNGTFARNDAAQTFAGTQTFSGKVQTATPTTSLASINFPSGVSPTSPGTGDTWFDGTHLNFYNGTSTKDLLSGSCTGCVLNNGNSFGAAFKIGSSDVNPIIFQVNGAQVGEFYTTSGDFSLGSGSGGDPGKLFYCPGTSEFTNAITFNGNAGISVLSGFNFTEFFANNGANGYARYMGMNNVFTTGKKSFVRMEGSESFSSSNSTVTEIDLAPTLNDNTSTGDSIYGFRWRPVLTDVSGTTVFAWWNENGGLIHNSGIPSGTGSENILVQGVDSNQRQITPAQLATSLGIASHYQTVQASGSGQTQRPTLNFTGAANLISDDATNTSTDVPLHGMIYSATANGTAYANSTTQTALTGASGIGSLTVAANSMYVGETFTFHGWAQVSTTTGSQTLDIGPLVSTGSQFNYSILNLSGSLSNSPLEITASITILTTGSSGTYSSAITVNLGGGGSIMPFTIGTTGTLNTTASNSFSVQATWIAANAANSINLLTPFILKIE